MIYQIWGDEYLILLTYYNGNAVFCCIFNSWLQVLKLCYVKWQTANNTNSTRSCCLSSDEVVDLQEDGTERQCGVAPIELERKLHELLEARQEERIKELEGALECAKQEVIDKESEVSWWKETAKVISKHIPAHSRLKLASQHDQLQLLR